MGLFVLAIGSVVSMCRRALGVVIVVLCCGCGAMSRGGSNLVKGTPVSPQEKQQVLRTLAQRDDEISNFRGVFRSTFAYEDDKWNARQAVVFQKPDRLRIEALPTVGVSTISLLIARGGTATYLDVPNKRAYRGSAENEFFNQFLKVSASERELMSLFVGRIPSRYLGDAEVRDAGETFTIIRGGYIWSVDKKSMLCRVAEVRDPFHSNLLFTIEYGAPKEVTPGAGLLPSQVRIISHKGNSTASGDLISGQINSVIDQSVFESNIPVDFSREGR